MEKFRGVLQMRLRNIDSRSEGLFPFLVCEDKEYDLCREGGVPFNDPYYTPYHAQMVEVTGYLSHEAIVVESIEIINIENEKPKEE